MMRVAFSLIGHAGWTGGSHYQKNLLSALKEVSRGDIEPFLFAGDDRLREIDMLRPSLSGVVVTRSFSEWTPSWIARQFLRRTFDNDLIVGSLFRRKNVDVAFHAGLFGSRFPVPCVNWIADFQHVHLPDMFTDKERKFRSALIREYAMQSARLVVSSEAAKKDFKTFFPGYPVPVDVLRFVAQVPPDVYDDNPLDLVSLYNIPEKFFYLPNQFWKHKNHLVVLEALRLLNEQDRKVFVVCTGNETDQRNPGYYDFLKQEISRNALHGQIALLGLIPLRHVFLLMRQSVSVLNPSFFEGWSTTVEEVKSLGGRIMLSDIPVHREQSPDGGVFFDPASPEDLADKMMTIWKETPPGPDVLLEKKARSLLKQRTRSFGESVRDTLGKALHKGRART